MPEGRIRVSEMHYNDEQMTTTNSIYRALLQNPTKIVPMLTFLGGEEDKRFPLSWMTEGVGNSVSIDTLEYEYDIMTRVNPARALAVTVGGGSPLGTGGAMFNLPFPDKWLIPGYTIVAKSGVQVRIMGQPTPNGTYWNYPCKIVENNSTTSVPATDLVQGTQWAMLYAAVGVDFSRGLASNWAAPSKIRQKLTTCRKSYSFSGNAKDTVVSFQVPKEGGGMTNYWMDFEEWQYMLQFKMEKEMLYWYASQSYNAAGETGLVDENGSPIIIAPGLLAQIPNKATYAELTTSMLDGLMTDIFFGMSDAQNKQITLYTGTGGAREFDRALKDQNSNNAYRQSDVSRFIVGTGRNLKSTGFFTTYDHVDGYTLNVVRVPLFDHGAVAQVSPLHPESGLPLESYRMVFVDQSRYSGKPNLMMVHRKGREMLRWCVSGSIIPNGFSGNDSRATDVDGASVHMLKTGHVLLRRFDTSIDLQCVAGL